MHPQADSTRGCSVRLLRRPSFPALLVALQHLQLALQGVHQLRQRDWDREHVASDCEASKT